MRTIKFTANKNKSVYARRFGKSKHYFFSPVYCNKRHESFNDKIDENYIWLFDLKDSHAQRIAQNYASKLARVGLDESEWLRRWSGN